MAPDSLRQLLADVGVRVRAPPGDARGAGVVRAAVGLAGVRRELGSPRDRSVSRRSGRYRRRRYAVFAIDASGRIERQPHQPHYQGQEYNQLFGGVERWFEPIAEEVAASATMATILRWCDRLFAISNSHIPRSPSPLARVGRSVARRGASVPHRGPRRGGRPSDARRRASRWRRFRAGAAGQPREHRRAARPPSSRWTAPPLGSSR